jgi:hypothetical protein
MKSLIIILIKTAHFLFKTLSCVFMIKSLMLVHNLHFIFIAEMYDWDIVLSNLNLPRKHVLCSKFGKFNTKNEEAPFSRVRQPYKIKCLIRRKNSDYCAVIEVFLYVNYLVESFPRSLPTKKLRVRPPYFLSSS